ncbi:MAG: 30S ribosomal protein S4, partial [Nanoarchaeota archaeon]
MGDPKKQKKKFSTPNHPWQKERIEAEKEILKQYGLRRKYEIWKMDSMLKDFLNRAKTLIAQRNPQSELEKKQLLQRLNSLGLLKKDSKVEDVLNLTLKDVM